METREGCGLTAVFHRVALAAGGGWTMGQEDVCGDYCQGGSSGVGRSGWIWGAFSSKASRISEG